MKAKITSKGQITIPKPLRQKYGLRTGTVLEFDESAPMLTARRVVSRAQMERAVGVLERELAGRSSAQWLASLRGKADFPRS